MIKSIHALQFFIVYPTEYAKLEKCVYYSHGQSFGSEICFLITINSAFCLSVHQLVKLCSGMIEAGRVYVSANKLFVNGIRDLSHHCKKEEMISVSFPDK